MTCCVAAICDEGKTIIFAADRMVGVGFIESEMDISKIVELHKGWMLLISGDDITPVFDIVDYVKQYLRDHHIGLDDLINLHTIMEAVKSSYDRKRIEEVESLYLTPTGWDISTFNLTGHQLPDYAEIKAKINDYILPIEVMVVGFSDGDGHLFSLCGSGTEKGLIKRHDSPGFHAIGSGSYGALYMLYYRELSYKEKARAVAYYVMEAKLFGEQAGGVGEGTDMFVCTADGKVVQLNEDETIEKKLLRVWAKLRPRWFGKESIAILNSLEEMKEFAPLEPEKMKNSKKATPSDSQRSEDKP